MKYSEGLGRAYHPVPYIRRGLREGGKRESFDGVCMTGQLYKGTARPFNKMFTEREREREREREHCK
jgi:hypothetical protein